ncbi:hypothetical protein B0H13DRAFT_1899359 [Mycena leptocephala]|nr:hypothetical protein B0H13DRAFT_1899359 [Mycena leptocephala]
MPKSASQLYHGLTSQKHGIPQFTPEPNENLPIEYQKVGVTIGDVGIWHDGSFEVFFNVCSPATHSINGAHGVPEGFAPFPLYSRDISKRAYHSPGSIIASAKVFEVALNTGVSSVVTPSFPTTVGSSVTFKFQSKEGAILVLPDGASRQNLLPVETFRAYARHCSPQWYTFARDCLPSAGSLFVVTGCDKAASWGIATASTTSGAVEISLKFAVVGVAEVTLAPRYQWKDFGSATVRTSGEKWSAGTENQCIFIRGFLVPRRIPLLTSVVTKILSRGLEGVLAKRMYEGVHEHGFGEERTYGSTTDVISISEARAGVQEESENENITPGIQALPWEEATVQAVEEHKTTSCRADLNWDTAVHGGDYYAIEQREKITELLRIKYCGNGRACVDRWP